MAERPEPIEDVPPEGRDALLATPVEYRRGGSLALQIKTHWRKYRPEMAGELDQAGALDEAVRAAEERTVSAYEQAIRAGLSPDQARELVREDWAFLPDEEDGPRLEPDGTAI